MKQLPNSIQLHAGSSSIQSRYPGDAMSQLTEFYQGTGLDTEGRTLAQIWAFSDEAMEDDHDFIQWLFPLREPSRFNPDAPPIGR
jgi:hypothetical protein